MADGGGTPVTDFTPEVGVLIVHGIGTQSEGSELRQWVDALLRYLGAFPKATQPVRDTRILQPSTAGDKLVRLRTPPLGGNTDPDRQDWLVGEAFWADAFDVPDRSEVTRWLRDIASWFVYLFVVRLWRRFHVDWLHLLCGLGFAGSLGWFFHGAASGHPGPWTWCPLVVIGAAVVATMFLFPKRREGKRLGSLVVAMSLLVGYPLAALAAAGALLLWLIGLLPGRVSKKARAIQVSLARSVGDVYALIASPRREQAMFDAIAAAAKRLATAPGMEGKPLVIVAHSQGSALMYRAFNHDDGLHHAIAGRDVTLVTYGEAILPVQLLEHHLRDPDSRWQRVQGFAGLVGLLLFAFTLARLASDTVDLPAKVAAGVSFALVAFSFLTTWRQERRARCEAAKVTVSTELSASANPPPAHPAGPARRRVCVALCSQTARSLRWVDLWAPWDPVPNGPLSLECPCTPTPCGPGALGRPSGSNEFLSSRAANTHQPWRDHVVYRANPEDVVSRWVGEIAARARGAVEPRMTERPRRPGATADMARTWRLHRGVLLFTAQAITAVLGLVALIWHWRELADLGRRAAHRFPIRSVLANVVDAVPHGARDGVFGAHRDSSHLQGLVVGLAAVAVLAAVESIIVGWWQTTATNRYLAGAEDKDLRGVVGLGVAAGMAAVALIGYFAVLMPSHITVSPTRTVTVHPATITSATGTRTSQHTKVSFEPVGTGDDSPVVVEVGSKVQKVKLDGDIEYRVTATVAGSKDCAAAYNPTVQPTDVTVTCAASAAVLPKGNTGR